MAFITKTFDLFYKRFPTGSYGTYVGNVTEFWYTASVMVGATRVSHSFLNYPTDVNGATYLTSRDSQSLNNKFHRAIPWGSAAADMLWNVTVPSWSFQTALFTPDTSEFPANTYSGSFWNCSFAESKSFHSNYYPGGATLGIGRIGSYNITSSWAVVDGKVNRTGIPLNFSYVTFRAGTGSLYPTYIGSTPITTTDSTNESFGGNQISYRIVYPEMSAGSTSSLDGQYFDQAGGACISINSVSESMRSMSLYAADDTPTGLNNTTRALKNRRLFFPTPYSGSGTTNGTDYWFKEFTGYRADEIFNENGGIYNVQLTLKRNTRYLAQGFYPQTGSYLNIFIHNVVLNAPSSSQRIPGAEGWYPPANNIVRIDHGTNPTMSFYDIQTGYVLEKFNFNVVQYGYPAQFCIEPSGSDNSYFGIIVDDISICKVGVTTDPSLIKPLTIGSITQTQRRQDLGIEQPLSPDDLPTD